MSRSKAEWAPSRFRLSLFKLLGAAVASVAPSRAHNANSILNRYRHHHPVETFSVESVYFVIGACYLGALVSPEGEGSPSLLALIIAAALTPLMYTLIEVTLGIPGSIVRRWVERSWGRGSEVSAYTFHLAMTTVSAYVAVAVTGWIRWLALVWLFLVMANLLAYVLVRLCRKWIESVENTIGGEPFEPSF